MLSRAAISTACPAARRRLRRISSRVRQVGILPPLLLLAFIAPVPSGSSIAGVPSLCLFHYLTALPCPLCGITRAVVCCAHGMYREAVAYHPLGPPVFAVLIVLATMRVTNICAPALRITLPPRLAPLMLGMAVLSTTIIWGARLTGALPAPP